MSNEITLPRHTSFLDTICILNMLDNHVYGMNRDIYQVLHHEDRISVEPMLEVASSCIHALHCPCTAQTGSLA